MAKFHLNIFLESKKMTVLQLVNIVHCDFPTSLFVDSDQYVQISGGESEKYDGYVDLSVCDTAFMKSVDGMYKQEIIKYLKKFTEKSSCFTILYVGGFGYRFVDRTLYAISRSEFSNCVLILDDQVGKLQDFDIFYRQHLNKAFFWLPPGSRP